MTTNATQRLAADLPAYVPAARQGDPDDVLRSLRRVLGEMYGERLERVVLFGSRARGDANPDSDYDVAVFLKTLPDFWAESDRLGDLHVRFLDDFGAFVEAMPFASSDYADRTPLLHEIRKDGIDVWSRRPKHSLRKRSDGLNARRG